VNVERSIKWRLAKPTSHHRQYGGCWTGSLSKHDGTDSNIIVTFRMGAKMMNFWLLHAPLNHSQNFVFEQLDCAYEAYSGRAKRLLTKQLTCCLLIY